MRLPPSCVNSAEAGPGEWPNIIVTPNSLVDDDQVHTITVNSTGLVEGCVAMVSTPYLRHLCTFISPTEVTFDIDLSTYAPYGGIGMPVWLLLPNQTRSTRGRLATHALPTTLESVTPDTADLAAGSADLTVIGTNFTLDWMLMIGEANVGKTVVSPTEMFVPGLPLAVLGEGVHPVYMRSSYGAGNSNELTFTVTAPPRPTIASLSPASISFAAGATTFDIIGTLFAPGMGVKVANQWATGFVVASDTLITGVPFAPPGTGNYPVMVQIGGSTAGDSNTVQLAVTA